jgi:acetyl esterase/lipase
MNLPVPVLLWLLRLSRRRERFESVEGLRKAALQDRQRRNVPPPAQLTKIVRISQRQLAGATVYTLSPLSQAAGKAARLLYLHGGAYVTQITPEHWRLVAELVAGTGCSAEVPLYPLAPEHDHRAAFALLRPLYRELASGTDPLVVMGDSAGGGLALALAQDQVDAGEPPPGDLILLSPWLDLSLSLSRAAAERISDPWLAAPGLAEAARWWAGGVDMHDARLSPLNGRLQGLGRLCLFIGQREMFLPEAYALREHARCEGVPLEFHEAPRMIHVWPLLPVREARAARLRMAEIVRGALCHPQPVAHPVAAGR